MSLRYWSRSSPTRRTAHRPSRYRLAVELLEDRTVPTAVAPPSGLVSWWTADTTAADLTGRNNATLSNVTYAAGEDGQAFNFNGSNGWAALGDPSSLAFTQSFSIEGWIKVNGLPTNYNFGTIMFRGDDRGGLDPYTLVISPNGNLQFGIDNASNQGIGIQAPIATGQWVHVAATLDDATGLMTLYENGAVVAQTTTTIRPFGALDPTQQPGVGIGNSNALSNYDVPFNGLIDELAVYNRALTAAEVQGIYNAGSDGKIHMFVATTSPDQGSVVGSPPTSFAVHFSSPYNAATLQPTQFQVNGTPATSVALTDVNTVTFTFATSPVTGQGLQTMHLDAGAVTRASDSLASAEYSATFRYDMVPLQVTSTDPAVGTNLTVQTFPTANRAVASMAGMKGGDGGWPVLYGSGAVGPNGLQLAIDEDNLLDTERSHTNEQVAFLALDGATSGNAAPYLRSGVVSNVNNASWTTVTLDRSYASMVVVATADYTNASVPLVARVRNAAGNSFQVEVSREDGQTGTVPSVSVDYLIVEEGVYTAAGNGVTMEAVKFNSTVTDNHTSWVGEARSYANAYTSPVVLGQVMTANDPNFSVFWARGADRTLAPSSTALYVGKHVGEDPNTTRANETIGYIVIEGGRGTLGGTNYLAGVGAAAVQGMDNAPPFTYNLTTATLTAHFNEPFDPASLSATDLSVSQGIATAVTAVDAQTAQFSLLGVVPDLDVSMAADALTDVYGNPSLPFSAAYYSGTTKFYVVNDGGPDRTHRYSVSGTPLGSSTLDGGDTAPRGAASNAAGTFVWVVDANRQVYVYQAGGALVGKWILEGQNPSLWPTQPEGITTNGTDVWVVDKATLRVYKYTGAASLRFPSNNPSANSSFKLDRADTNPTGIVTDGSSFWVVDDGVTVDKVFKYSLSGSLLGSWTLTGGGGSPTGITLNPVSPSDLWVVDNATLKVYQYAAAVGRTSGSQNAAAYFALAVGDTNPQDIADPPPADEWVATVPALPAPPTAAVPLIDGGWFTNPAAANPSDLLRPDPARPDDGGRAIAMSYPPVATRLPGLDASPGSLLPADAPPKGSAAVDLAFADLWQ
jgi:hypothetical protein